jgi:Methyltransferase domain
MKTTCSELGRLLKVTALIMARYLGIPRRSEESWQFFADLYSRYCADRALRVPEGMVPIDGSTLFPELRNTSLSFYAPFGPLWSGQFSAQSPSLVSPRELWTLGGMVKVLQPGSIFEFGTYHGWTTANLAMNAPEGCKLYTMDQQRLPHLDPWIERVFREKSVVQLTADSREYDYDTHRGTMDFIFIDGDHSRGGVENDTMAALGMLAENGTIVWHDYNPEHEHVVAYLNSMASERQLFFIKNTRLVVYSRAREPMRPDDYRETSGRRPRL